ncbi:hypothetical protein [Microbacterium aurum]
MKKKIAAIILAAAAATVSVAGVGAPAYADGNGIAFGSDGTVVVLGVKGTYNRVTSMSVAVNYSPPVTVGTICDGQARGYGTLLSGSAWSKTWGTYSGCFPLAWSSATSVNKDFKSHTNMTGRAFHDGKLNSGAPTVPCVSGLGESTGS